MSRMTKDERQSGGSRFLGDLEPQKREWVGLTDEEIHNADGYTETREMYRLARAIEAKLKEMNGG